jgi:D-alanine-D-alanine ligase
VTGGSNLGKVAVMFGGDSAEREISLKSGNAVLAALCRAGVDAHAFDPSDRPLVALKDEGFARVFIALHGRGGEDGCLQGALDLMRIPYTGSGVLASALALDKWRSKLCWQAAGIAVPECVVLTAASDWQAVADRLGLPLFVKPANEGSSIGITKVRSASELRAAYETAAKYDTLVIAERFLSGGEFTVGILGSQALPVIRIVPATDFYDYEAKYFRDDTRYLIPSGLTTAQEQDIRELALKAFEVLGGRGWGRIDVMLDGAGRAYCLEANMSPGMTDHSLVPMAARAAGLTFEQLVVQVLEGAAHG